MSDPLAEAALSLIRAMAVEHPAEFDRIATERGYVKREDAYPGQGGPEMWISDSDGGFRVSDEIGSLDHARPLVVGDLERLGYVKRPVCGECEGRGVWGGDPDDPKWEKFPEMTNVCPSCGGSGFGRLVALDGIDLGGLREALAWHPKGLGELARDGIEYRVLEAIEGAARQVLAALDGGQE